MAPKVKAAKTEPGVRTKIEKDVMPKDEVTRMLNDLRYQASNKCRNTPEFKNQAAHALELYRSLKGPKKHEFLKAYNKSKRDLSWTATLEHSETAQEDEIGGSTSGFMTGPEIMALNKMPTSLSKAVYEQTLADLLQEAEKIHGITCTKIEHENPLLCKWYYVKS
eukprot:9486627-Lingulodinium_polyedra.AAC.1